MSNLEFTANVGGCIVAVSFFVCLFIPIDPLESKTENKAKSKSASEGGFGEPISLGDAAAKIMAKLQKKHNS